METEVLTELVQNIIALLTAMGITKANPAYAQLVSCAKEVVDISQQACLSNTIKTINKRLSSLERTSISYEYLQTPFFVELVKQFLYESNIHDLEQKKNAYANFFASCCTRASVEQLNIQRNFRILRELDILELCVLKELPIHYVAKCNQDSLYHLLLKQYPKISKMDVISTIDSLRAKGLVRNIDNEDIAKHPSRFGNIRTRGEQEYYIRTSLGDGVLDFVGHKPESVL